MAIRTEKKSAKKEAEAAIILKHKYINRITIAKFGKQAFIAGDFANTIRKYSEYLDILGEVHRVHKYALVPEHFDKKKDITEMLLISHVYFELAKVYDVNEKFQEDCKKCLQQFVLFSINQPYQVLNSEMLRKSSRKFKFRNPELFANALKQIFVQSKKCYVVSFCYGEDHPETEFFRSFKSEILKFKSGSIIVDLYYRVSSVLVEKLPNYPLTAKLFNLIAKNTLSFLSKVLRRTIMK